MRQDRQHEVVRDASLTFAHILKTHLPRQLEKGQQVEVVFEVPDAKKLEAAKKAQKVIVSLIWIDVSKSTLQQTTDQPIIREEDENGDLVEYKLGPPTFVFPRYMITPWSGDALVDQEVIGAIMRIFFQRTTFLPEDVQGKSIHAESGPMVMLVDTFTIERQMKLWQVMGHAYRPSVVYGVHLRMDSLQRSVVRRVRERILDFKKLEG